MPEAKPGLAPVPHWVGVAALVCSGFAGLVYEAAWARYLKQVLGHEAYAQALVIAIFLGGLALGAALAGRRVHRWRAPLVIYAAIEAVLALLALQFHDIFVAARALLEGGTLGGGEGVRWLAATLLILPQSVLLGATFPLLTAALARSHARSSGRTVSLMYFANSVGGALGALAVAFFLVELAGLPGAMLFGAIGSAAAALLAWVAHHRYAANTPLAPRPSAGFAQPPALLAAAAFGVGLAALVLEIVWIRKLALVLGSSTRAFELILAAFILGLAVGSLLAERLADRAGRAALLARVLLMMGALAVVSLFAYEHLFFVQAHINLALPKDDGGYLAYGLAGFGLALALMAGPTICSGMALPLLTREAMERSGERALGAIYAWNSLGSISGVLLASQLLLPALGLKLASAVGALLALALALTFLHGLRPVSPRSWRLGLGASLALVALVGLRAPYDQFLLSIGPYRIPQDFIKYTAGVPGDKMLFVRHGRTASIAVGESKDGSSRWIKTNGKSEGSIPVSLEPAGQVMSDLVTTMMLGALPLLYHPEARQIAMVGIGTGYTATTLLDSAELQKLYVLEIEEAVVDAGEFFPQAAQLYKDERAVIEVTDAKVYFSGLEEKLDIIVSEPSNPWVSGISSLFTVEHFAAMRSSLADDGVLVQWFHTYESSPEAMATILLALSEVFPDYVIYMGGPGDLIVLASPDPGRIAAPDPQSLELNPKLAERLKLLKLEDLADVAAQSFADKSFIDPYVRSVAVGGRVAANSDYFPVLDSYAARNFFLREENPIISTLYEYGRLSNGSELPHRAFRSPFLPDQIIVNGNVFVEQMTTAMQSVLTQMSLPELFELLAERKALEAAQLATVFDPDCAIEDELKFKRMSYLLRRADFFANNLLPQERRVMWQRLNAEVPCIESWRTEERAGRLWDFYNAFFVEDYPTVVRLGNELLPASALLNDKTALSVLIKVMLSEYARGNYEQVVTQGLRMGLGDNAVEEQAISIIVAHALAAADLQR